VLLVLLPEAPELLVLGHQSPDQRLPIHAGLLLFGRTAVPENKQASGP
jgi:hypothetical protein